MALLWISLLLLAADQLVKYIVVAAIGGAAFSGAAFSGVWLTEALPLIPGVLGLNFATNTGAAWSLFAEHTWLLALISLFAAGLIVALLWRRVFPHPLSRVALALILGGALGNLMDRLLRGYVVDMFEVLFFSFPVFNVADIGITIGGALLMFSLIFLERDKPAAPGKSQPKGEKNP